jgi:hypothetical protein
MTLATATRQTWSVLIILKIKNHAQLPQILDILPTLLRIYGIVGNQLVSLVFCGIAAVQFDFYFRSLVCILCRLALRCLRDRVWGTITASINAQSSSMIGERNNLCVMTVWESVIHWQHHTAPERDGNVFNLAPKNRGSALPERK